MSHFKLWKYGDPGLPNLMVDPTAKRGVLNDWDLSYDEVLHLIKSSNLVGQSIISYLQKKGYPEVGCGNLGVALETAEQCLSEYVHLEW